MAYVTNSGRVWRKMPESDARSVISAQTFQREPIVSVDTCAEIKNAPSVTYVTSSGRIWRKVPESVEHSECAWKHWLATPRSPQPTIIPEPLLQDKPENKRPPTANIGTLTGPDETVFFSDALRSVKPRLQLFPSSLGSIDQPGKKKVGKKRWIEIGNLTALQHVAGSTA